MRLFVFGMTALAIIFGLLLFDDMDIGLAIVGLIVWLAVLVAGLLLVLRSRALGRRRLHPRPPRRQRLEARIEARRREKPLFLPRR